MSRRALGTMFPAQQPPVFMEHHNFVPILQANPSAASELAFTVMKTANALALILTAIALIGGASSASSRR
jgi:hypothetical protein